jgi:DNA polymerase III sliding clamp (beta) subunit (PCNA family)
MTATATFNGAALLAELRFVSKANERRSTIPILGNTLLKLTPAALTLTATNLDVTARAECDALSGDGSASITAPGDLLISALSDLIGDDTQARVEFRIRKGSVDLACDGCEMKIDGLPAYDYPALSMKNENSMVVFRPVDSDGEYTYVLMPMRLV